MAVTEIPWNDGSGGKIYLTYPSASGDQTVEVSSDANTGIARTKTVTISAAGVPPAILTVNQAAGTSSIPYIRNTDLGAYIDTGITPDQNTRVIVWARNFNQAGGNYNWLFGSRTAQNDSMFELALGANATSGSISFQFGDASNWYDDAWKYCSGYHKYEMSKDGLFVDDTQLKPASSATFSNSANIHLFGYNSEASGHHGSTLPVDICACKIYKDGVLVRDFNAVNTPSVGLYDSISGTLFTNAGSGSFTYGTFNPNAYTPLEYIECTGAQYFDSGIKGGYSVPAVIKFKRTDTASRYNYFFGSRNGSSSKCDLSIGGSGNKICYFAYRSQTGSATQVYSASSSLVNRDFVFVKNNNVFTLYENNTQRGTKTGTSGSSFVTDYNMYVGNLNTAGTPYASGYVTGLIYYLGFGANRNFVPAKVNNIAGMYDTYNDIFYQSESGTDFVAGPEL